MSEKPEETQVLEEQPAAPKEKREEIKFQRIMHYKAYRRGMMLKRLGIALLLMVASAFTGYISILFGIALPVFVLIIVSISILASMGNEQTYNVYNTRVVFRKRGDDGRRSVPLDSIMSVKYKSAWYEKRMCVGTVTVTAKNDKGQIKKYKMKHILDAKPVVEYLNSIIDGRKTDDGKDSE
ncbi:MAG: hypothetical protein J1F69_03840 [Clostridiales bacterium]|nr:hypothetical protein [Clostridiales bacterium]